MIEECKKKIEKPKKSSTENGSRGEKIYRREIEKMSWKSFVKIRPNFLKNEKTGSNLELDCFNKELKIAVEYNGKQHYKFIPFFHKSMLNSKK